MISINYDKYLGMEDYEYEVDISRPMTVREFIDEWLKEQPREWGKFQVPTKGPSWRYECGKLIDPVPEEYLDRELADVEGRGGWSYSSFTFILKEELK